MSNKIKKLVVVGGGTAGWMAAATLSRFVDAKSCEIVLVESEEIGTVGVGEATIPQIQLFNKTLDLDEDEFLRKTNGTFKLGIEFVDWGEVGDSYIHAFGPVGRDMESLPFYNFWLKLKSQGKTECIEEFCLNSLASQNNKFMRSIDAGNSPLSNINYAFHFDAGLYAKFLRDYAEKRGVKRLEGKIKNVKLSEIDGSIDKLFLESGKELAGDFYIDCTGFRALLLNGALGVGYEDWSGYLPCNRAWAVPSEKLNPLPSYTRATARSAGWQWRIPLQHRTGNGHVFSSQFISEEAAREELISNLKGAPIAEPRLLSFVTGRRKKFWEKNCLAIGLASGFMEPLESTSIHLVQSALARFMSMFPRKDQSQEEIDAFNAQTVFEYERIRDFLILHYKATNRTDTPFWNYCRNMPIPDTLKEKIEVFKAGGQVHRFNNELFNEISWVEVLIGQRIMPRAYHPLVDNMDAQEFQRRMQHVKRVIDTAVDYMPDHEEFLKKHNLLAVD